MAHFSGQGLGLKRDFIDDLIQSEGKHVDFLEVAPENWMKMGGTIGKKFKAITDKYPMICHGLSLSIGSPAPLDEQFILDLKDFFKEYNILHYSEHLSYCSDKGHLYDLMPIPFTEEAVHYTAKRIRRVQELLEQEISMENVSYYAAPGQEMTEIDFFNAVIAEAECSILLDVNNVYVNSVNHNYIPEDFINQIDGSKINYLHIAGHYNEADDLIIDTHGADVADPVWDLLRHTYQQHGVLPTLLERDFNIPNLGLIDPKKGTMLSEINTVKEIAGLTK